MTKLSCLYRLPVSINAYYLIQICCLILQHLNIPIEKEAKTRHDLEVRFCMSVLICQQQECHLLYYTNHFDDVQSTMSSCSSLRKNIVLQQSLDLEAFLSFKVKKSVKFSWENLLSLHSLNFCQWHCCSVCKHKIKTRILHVQSPSTHIKKHASDQSSSRCLCSHLGHQHRSICIKNCIPSNT